MALISSSLVWHRESTHRAADPSQERDLRVHHLQRAGHQGHLPRQAVQADAHLGQWTAQGPGYPSGN